VQKHPMAPRFVKSTHAPLRGRVRLKAPVIPAAKPKPKGPAWTPRKPRPAPKRVAHPQRLRVGSPPPEAGGIYIGGARWGSPFRPRELDGRWVASWVGHDLGIEHLRPVGWEAIPCQDRREAAQVALCAFEDWLLSPDMAPVLEHARRALRGFNLVCLCPSGHPCHGDVLLEAVNEEEPT
jgi:hypothetical protein